MFINFCDIPKNHNLFLDFLYEFENVSEFYPNNFRNKESYQSIFKQVSDSRKNRKFSIASIIENQYTDITNVSNTTKKNIEKLSDPATIAVITGQQIGILGGPLYTINKIITTIKLAQQMNERYDEYNFVPVFWMETDDNDFNEVRSVNLIGSDNQVVNVGYKEEISDDEIKKSVGTLVFDESLNDFFNLIESNLRDTDFKSKLLDNLKSFYQQGKTFKQSFKELIFWLFDNKGLVLFDPQDQEVKKLLIPVFKKEVTDFREHTQKLILTSAKLEEIYHAQVKVKPVNLFYSTDDGRHSIEPVEDTFRLKRKRKQFSKEEILLEIENAPERFSPNVLLRPICQDYLFPTGFYIAGPSEISYFAQVKPLYDFYEITYPIIYPRSSATIEEKNIESLIEKYELNFSDIFLGFEELKEKVIKSLAENNLEEVFKNTCNEIELTLDRLKENLFSIDKTIADSSNKYREKILSSIDELKSKALKAQENKFETTVRQLSRLENSLYPNDNLQERELNFSYFYNKFGDDFLKLLFEKLSINEFEHQVISI